MRAAAIPRNRSKQGAVFALIAVLMLLVSGTVLGVAGIAKDGAPAAQRAPLGLFGTLPIYWGESASLGAMLDGESEAHWARAELEQNYVLKPLDILGGGDAGEPLSPLDDLLFAQPRALSAAENVALDAWVRKGGHLLLFADPMLTGHSLYPVGDSRRPHDVVLLSPILAHWGLRLEYDDAQEEGERVVAVSPALSIPVNLPGRLASLPASPDRADPPVCAIAGGGLVAQCAIGAGKALIVADAALLEPSVDALDLRKEALSQLASEAFVAR